MPWWRAWLVVEAALLLGILLMGLWAAWRLAHDFAALLLTLAAGTPR